MDELRVGDRIKDNDPRMGIRILTIIEVTPKEVLAENKSRRVFSIRPDRIYTDGKPRRTGFSRVIRAASLSGNGGGEG